MATIDDKVVAISFESSKFESGVNKTIAALDKLKSALHFPNAGKGMADINAAAQKVDLSHIENGVGRIRAALDTLRLVAIGVMAQLATQAVRSGAAFVKAFTLDPAKAGYQEYATNLNAIQTILANTQAAGTKLKDVNAALRELNEYSDKTIYNFSQMAKNIGTFTAAGVDLDTATASIKGIANLAALSGSNSEQASTAMYQLSQAISAGRVSLQDWNSVVNAGMGGTVFQRALAQTAEAMGTLKEGTVKLEGPMKNVTIAGESFRQSVSAKPGEESWLTSKVLTSTLQQFTGDLTKAELKAQGFNDAQIKAIQATAKTAFHAATEVKTLTQVLDVAKESAASGWAQTWQIIFGDFGEAKKTFTDLSNTINGFINASADARNKVLQDWKDLGGRTVLIDGIKTAFHNLGLILKPIKEAFRDVFPATTGKNLYDLTVRFKEFAEALKPSETTVENLKRTFRGLFALLDIGKQIIGGIFTVFGKLFGAISGGSGGFLEITASVGDFIYKLDQALKKGDGINKFFSGLGDVLAIPLKLLAKLANALGDLFSGFSSGGFSDQITGMTGAMTPFQRVLASITDIWDRFVQGIRNSVDVSDIIESIATAIGSISEAIGKAAAGMNFEAIFAVIRTGLFAGLVLMLKNFFGKGSFLDQVSKGFAGGIIQNIAGSFKALEGSMVAMQQNIKAKTLKEIAIAVALLAASVVALSFVDPEKLTGAITAIGFMMAELLGAMAILDKISSTGGFIKLPIIAAGLIILAGAIDLLVIAVFALSKLSWEELIKGLGGVGALLVGLSGASVVLSKNSGGMIRAGIGITAIAIAMNLLALAVKQFSGLSWGEMIKGLTGVGGGLAVVAGAMQIMPKGMVLQSAALIAIAASLKILAGVVEQFSGMNWSSMAKGMAGIGGALLIIAGAMHLMPSNMVLTAAGLILVSLALGKIAAAVEAMGGMSIREIAKGLGTLAGALAILAGALYLMSGALAGAAALAIAAAGISLLVPAIAKLGGMSWGEIIKGLVSLGAALVIIGGTAALMSGAALGMLAFGAALVVIGAGLALAGAGIFLIGAGLSAIAVAGPAAIGILVGALVTLQKAIIENAKLIIQGLLEIVEQLAAVAPKFVDAIVKILNSLIDAIIQMSPKIGELFDALITLIIGVLQRNQGKIIQAGFDLIIALLTGIRNNIPALVTLIVDIITRILNTISNNLGRIITAGLNLLISFIKGIANGYAQVATAALEIVTKFLTTIANNLGKFITAGLSIVTSFLKGIASNLGGVIKAGTDIIVAFIEGIGNAGRRIVTAAVDTIIKFANHLAKESERLADEGFKALIKFINGITRAVNENVDDLQAAGKSLAWALINGMTWGLAGKAEELYGKLEEIAGKAKAIWEGAKGFLTRSPSKWAKEVGENISTGLAQGIEVNSEQVYKSAYAMAYAAKQAIKQGSGTQGELAEIGKFIGTEFAKGVRGSQDDIRTAFSGLNDLLTEAMVKARETIIEEEKKLEELRKAKKPDMEAIREAQKVIEKNEALLVISVNGHKTLTGTLKAEKAELLGLVADYERVSEQLSKAEEKLKTLQKAREDAFKAYQAQYATLPEITKGEDVTGQEQLATYLQALKDQAAAVGTYRETLDQLRKLGLDDATYQKLLEEGTADQQFATALLAGGKDAVAELNKLDLALQAEAKKLASNAARDLYKAGLEGAQKVVDGLKKKQNAVKQEAKEVADNVIEGIVNGLNNRSGEVYGAIESIANGMIAALKRQLKIKSPSQVFAEIGELSAEGFAQGFSTITSTIDNTITAAVNTMKKSINRISDAVTAQLDVNPVITPILDLTAIKAQAQQLKTLTNVTPITAAASFGQAALISATQLAAQEEQANVIAGRGSVIFEQNNYSPEALNEIEIYRQTKNQMSQLKSALSLT